MAGVAGLEPAHARIKTLCLTNLATPQSLRFYDKQLDVSIYYTACF